MMLAITAAMLTSYKNPYCLHAKPSNMQKSILITSRKSDNLRNLDSRISMKKNILSNIYIYNIYMYIILHLRKYNHFNHNNKKYKNNYFKFFKYFFLQNMVLNLPSLVIKIVKICRNIFGEKQNE